MTDSTNFAEDAANEMASATQRAREKIEAGVRYFQERDMDEVASDVGAMVRRHPVESLIAAAALGFLAARLLQRTADHYE